MSLPSHGNGNGNGNELGEKYKKEDMSKASAGSREQANKSISNLVV